MGTFISDLILALLSYVAETEYRTIHQRQAEGIATAKARGVKLVDRQSHYQRIFMMYIRNGRLGKYQRKRLQGK